MIVELTDVRPPKNPSFVFRASLFDSAHWEPAVGELPERTVVKLSSGILAFVKESPSEVLDLVVKSLDLKEDV